MATSRGRRLVLADTLQRLRAQVGRWRRDGLTVALVPTMGALHRGHLALVEAARAEADRSVVSVFVNPTQFAPTEDLSRYPRDPAGDAAKLERSGADLMYAPAPDVMYPEGFATTVRVGGLTDTLEGAARPGHFDGVATVVTKLLIQAAPDLAVFGEKDYQQLLVIRRLVRDLDLPVRIDSVPTVREPDGLAMSSRNARLGPEERALAGMLNRILLDTAERAGALMDSPERAVRQGREALAAAGFDTVDYLELRGAAGLERLERLDRPARLLAAVRLPSARLIDNVPVAPRG